MISTSKRMILYWITGGGLILISALIRDSAWVGNTQLHTIMEVTATLLSLFIGILALVRFYSKQDYVFLYVGTGFLGTAFLDGYHAIVTSTFFQPMMPSSLPALLPWSWVASRFFLSVMLFLTFVLWQREQSLGDKGRLNERVVYLVSAVFTISSFLFFAFYPLPTAYFADSALHRPEELVPALFFGLALFGFLSKGYWRNDPFKHWLVLSLIIAVISQVVFMSFSGQLFDMKFDVAHALKKVSYICVLVGLLINIFETYKRESKTVELIAERKKLAAEIEFRQLTEVELEKTVGNLRRSNGELENFAYIASHDLQEPLRKVQTFGDRLKQKYSGSLDERGLDYLERMQHAAGRMSILINDLLVFSRVTAKGKPFVECDLNNIIDGVLNDLEVLIEESNAKIRVDDLPTIEADPLQMGQLFQNLISNSIKYRDPERPLEVSISVVENNKMKFGHKLCQIDFKDNAIGFLPEYSEKIFEIFQRLHGRKDYSGTGLGLALVRRIAEHHGGGIVAVGKSGEGAIFSVTLSLEQDKEVK